MVVLSRSLTMGERGSERLLNSCPGLPFYALGVAALAGGMAHYLVGPSTAATFAESLVTVPVFATYTYSGYHLRDADLSPRTTSYLLLTTAVLGLFGVSVVGLFVGIQLLTGAPVTDWLYLLFLVGAVTSAIGPPVGYYYLRAESRREELVQRTDQVTALNQRLSVINRVLRHNIRNELTVLAGSLHELPPSVDDDVVARVEGSLDRLSHLSGHSETLRTVWETDSTQSIDVVPALADITAEIRAERPAVVVETSLPEAAAVRAHPKLEVALDELVTNAVVHNDPADLRVDVRVTRPDEHADTVRIEIADTGTGIPEGEASLVGCQEETDLEHGRGLGLWLAYWIVEKSDGDLDIDAEPGRGTRVTIDLPAVSEPAAGRRAAAKRAVVSSIF